MDTPRSGTEEEGTEGSVSASIPSWDQSLSRDASVGSPGPLPSVQNRYFATLYEELEYPKQCIPRTAVLQSPRVEEALRCWRAGAPSVLILSGGSGTGKTELLHQLQQRLYGEEARMKWYEGSDVRVCGGGGRPRSPAAHVPLPHAP